jgi:hypothetical protein
MIGRCLGAIASAIGSCMTCIYEYTIRPIGRCLGAIADAIGSCLNRYSYPPLPFGTSR